ncbi:MAG TPA: trimethylamine methyltransferase family protein [Thermoleophilia bacterium]|nr:trimethylamine methyltransferase family protein [Thermoleophilia bacterium]
MTENLMHTIGSAGRLAILSQDDLERLDAAALAVLAQTGVAIPSERARAALVAQGATADGTRITFPPELVRRLVDVAPAHMTLGARAGAALITGERSLVTTDGCCVEIYDLETGEKRGTTADDVATISRVVDALPEIDFCWPAVSAQDRPVETRGLHELYLAVANTGKHVQTVTVVEPELAGVAVEMALTVSGSEERLRAEPPISALLGTVTPLGNDEGTLEAGLVFAEAGVPIGFVTMPMGGSTTPITMAGSLVVGVAEALSSVCAIQAVCPGAPVFICFIPSVMDLKSGDFTGGAPEDTIMAAAVGDVGHFYGLPTQCGVNSSGAKEPGWQSALDDTTTTYLSLAAGVDMLTGVGMVSGGRIFSYEEMALGVDTLTHARTIAAGVDLTAAGGSAGGQAPPAAGPSLAVDKTHRHWTAGGRETAIDRAHERVAAAVAEHRPPALDPAVDEELRRLAGIG